MYMYSFFFVFFFLFVLFWWGVGVGGGGCVLLGHFMFHFYKVQSDDLLRIILRYFHSSGDGNFFKPKISIFSFFSMKYMLWVLIRNASNEYKRHIF